MGVEPVEVGPCMVVLGIGEEGCVNIFYFGVGRGWGDVREEKESVVPTPLATLFLSHGE